MKSKANHRGGMDWNLIDNIDPLSLKTDQGLSTMRLICRQFLETTTVPLDQPTRVLKLFQILQVIVGYFCTSQDTLNQKVEELTLGRREVVSVVGVQCPICMKVFESLTFLDKHIFNRHGEVAHFWQNFRTPPLPVPVAAPAAPAEPVQARANNEEQFHWLFEKLRKEMKKEQKERVKELNSLIKRKVSKVENKIENLQSTLKDPLAHTQPVVQYVPQPVVAPVEPAKKAPKKRRRQSLRRFEVETSPFKIAEAPRQTRPALVIDKIEPILNIAREEEPVERPSKPIQVIKKTPEPEPEETKPKIKKRKRRHSASGMNNESPKKVEAKQKPEPQPVVKVERSTVKPKTPIKIPEEKPKKRTPIKIPEEKPKKRTPIKIPEEKPKQQTTHESAKPLLKYQTQAPAPIDVPRASTARQIDFDEYNESENSTDEVIRISKPSLVARTDYQVTQQPVKVSRVSASHSRPFGLVDSETSQTMGTSPMASPTPTGKRSQFQVISGVNVSKASRSASERPPTSMDSNALVTADEITSEEPATPVQVSINIARYSPAPCMYSVASISSDTGSPRSPRGLTRSTIVVPEDELIVSESLSG